MSFVVTRIDADTAAPEDVAAIDRLLRLEARAFARDGEQLDDAAERLSEAAGDRERLCFVARRSPEGRVAGFLDAQLHSPSPGALTVRAIAVAPEARRRGVGEALLDTASRTADALDGEHASVWAGVHDDNAGALAFFSEQGFTKRGQKARVVELVRDRRR